MVLRVTGTVTLTLAVLFGASAANAADHRRTAFQNQSGAEALALAWSAFPAQLSQPAWQPLHLGRSDRIRRQLSDTAALVDHAGSNHPGLVESSSPMSVQDQDGTRRPLALDLEEAEGGRFLAPRRPLVRTQLGRRLDDGLRFQRSQLEIKLEASNGTATAVLRDDKAFYPNVGDGNDTDFIVAPVPTGLETFAHLRSARSPEQLSMSIAGPVGARFVASGSGALVLDRMGTRIAVVSPTAAWDANQRPVPVTMSARGEALILEIPHREQGVTYPVLVDPLFEDWVSGDKYANNWQNNPELDFLGWYPSGGTSATFSKRGTYSNGLYVSTTADLAGSYEWRWKAPGTSAIYRTEYGNATVTGVTGVNEGLRKPGNAWEETTNAGPFQPHEPSTHPTSLSVSPGYQIFCLVENPCGPQGSTPGSMAVFGLQAPSAAASVYLPGAKIFLWDDDRPYFTSARSSRSSWMSGGTGTVTATATDTGVGVRQMRASVPRLDGGRTLHQFDSGCVGDRHDRCYATWNAARPELAGSFGFDSATMPEGINRIGLAALDVVLNSDSGSPDNPDYAATTVPVKVDRTAPSITLSDELAGLDDEILDNRDYRLRIHAADGDPAAGAPDGSRQAGAVRLEVLIDGEHEINTNPACLRAEGSCGITRDLVFKPSEWEGGDHEIVVRAMDSVGHWTTLPTLTVWTQDEDDPQPEDVEESAARDAEQVARTPIAQAAFCPPLGTTGYSCTRRTDEMTLAVRDEPGLDDPADSPMIAGSGTFTRAAAARAPRWGLSDNNGGSFRYDRMKKLKVGNARLIIPWDVVSKVFGDDPPDGTTAEAHYQQPRPTRAETEEPRRFLLKELRRADKWANVVCPQRVCSMAPLVSFDSTSGNETFKPTPQQYVKGINAFRARYPFIRTYSPWNETNIDQALAGDPFRSGKFWQLFDLECHPAGAPAECSVIGGTFLDVGGLIDTPADYPEANGSPDGVKETYFEQYAKGMNDGRNQRLLPPAWGYHAYKMNHLLDSHLKNFLKQTVPPDGSAPPNVWLTEQGGLLSRDGCIYKTDENQESDRQQRSIRYMLGWPDGPEQQEGVVNRYRDRISRFYYYSWRATKLEDCTSTSTVEQRGDFDSGLVTPKREGAHSRLRTAYFCYRYKTNPQTGDHDYCLRKTT